jgi:hypothetical protein
METTVEFYLLAALRDRPVEGLTVEQVEKVWNETQAFSTGDGEDDWQTFTNGINALIHATPAEATPAGEEVREAVDVKAQEFIDANPGCTMSAAYRAVALALAAQGDSGRERVLNEAVEMQCKYCRGEHGQTHGESIMQTPEFFDKPTYVPNCGEVVGWQHHQSWGGYVDCEADNLRRALATRPTEAKET